MVRISMDIDKDLYLLLNQEAGRRKAEELGRNSPGRIVEDALRMLLEGNEVKK